MQRLVLLTTALLLCVACSGAPSAAAPTVTPVLAIDPTAPAPTAEPTTEPTAASADATATPLPTAPAATTAPVTTTDGTLIDTTPRVPVAGGPTLHDSRLGVRRVATIPVNSIRLAYDAPTQTLLMLNMEQGLVRIDPQSGAKTIVSSPAEMLVGATASGLAVTSGGTVFVSGNLVVEKQTQAVVRRGIPTGSGYRWETVARTVSYPRSDTPFDHLVNGIAISPDESYIVVNSGSRTDHGEIESQNGAFPDTREVALTARMFKLPIDGVDILLENDETAVAPYVYARGFRNSYDPIFAPNGVLYAGDNGPDADFPDELNAVVPGKHYGFPWRFGTIDTPQRDPAYDPSTDRYLNADFTAVQIGAYANDPTYPPAPPAMVDPIVNSGPDGVWYRAADGSARDAGATGETVSSFTPHRSPLGLSFLGDTFPAAWQSTKTQLQAVILSWGAAGGDIPDRGQDMLLLQITPGAAASMTSRQLVTDLRNPIDSVAVGTKVYVLEFGDNVALWEISFGD